MKTYSIIQRNKAQGRKTWYLRTYDNESGKTTFKSLKTDKKHAAAEILHATINSENESQEQKESRKFSALDLRAAFSEYLRHYDILNASKNTIDGVKSGITKFIEFCHLRGVDLVKDISPHIITAYLSEMKAGVNTRRKRHQQLKTFYKWILEFYDIEKKNVFSKVKPPRAETSRRFFWTGAQIDEILNATQDPQRRLFYALMAFEGLRYIEAARLQWDNITADRLEVIGKGRKFAAVPLSDRMRAEFIRFGGRQDNGAIFTRRFHNSEENKLLQALCKRIFIEDETPIHLHRFRHSFGSNLIKAGASIVAVSKLMRHENANITLKYYAHVLNEDLQEAINKL